MGGYVRCPHGQGILELLRFSVVCSGVPSGPVAGLPCLYPPLCMPVPLIMFTGQPGRDRAVALLAMIPCPINVTQMQCCSYWAWCSLARITVNWFPSRLSSQDTCRTYCRFPISISGSGTRISGLSNTITWGNSVPIPFCPDGEVSGLSESGLSRHYCICPFLFWLWERVTKTSFRPIQYKYSDPSYVAGVTLQTHPRNKNFREVRS